MANVLRAQTVRKGFVSLMKAPVFQIARTKTADPTDVEIFVAPAPAKQRARRPGNAMDLVHRNVKILSAGMMVVGGLAEVALRASPVWMGSALPTVNRIVQMRNAATTVAAVPAVRAMWDRVARKAHAWTSAPRIARDYLAGMMDAVETAAPVKKEQFAPKDNA